MHNRTPFETDGHFYAGHVKHRGYDGRTVKRRCLCFALSAGIVGASVNFSRAEAYHTAKRAASGALPLPDVQPNAGSQLAAVLQARGFPIRDVRDSDLEIDETTAELVGKEFSR